MGFAAMSGFLSIDTSILIPVAMRSTAKKIMIQPNFITSAAPTPIMIARSASHPEFPRRAREGPGQLSRQRVR